MADGQSASLSQQTPRSESHDHIFLFHTNAHKTLSFLLLLLLLLLLFGDIPEEMASLQFYCSHSSVRVS
jgi:hypothetical protein